MCHLCAAPLRWNRGRAVAWSVAQRTQLSRDTQNWHAVHYDRVSVLHPVYHDGKIGTHAMMVRSHVLMYVPHEMTIMNHDPLIIIAAHI